MEGANSTPIRRSIPVILILAGIIGLYYLYYYLYGPKINKIYKLLDENISATIDPIKPIIITSDKLPMLYEGGEFTISSWVYINNWSYRNGFSKSIISIGGPNFDIIRIYLGGYKPQLSVSLHTRESGSDTSESLERSTVNMVFNSLQTGSGLMDSLQICDLPEIEMQRWVNITVAVNNKTVDVYLSGKLARSCVLPKQFKVDGGGYSANLLAYGGFGGQLSSTMMFDTALNPEQVYKNYMLGPEPQNDTNNWIIYLLLIIILIYSFTGNSQMVTYISISVIVIYIFYTQTQTQMQKTQTSLINTNK